MPVSLGHIRTLLMPGLAQVTNNKWSAPLGYPDLILGEVKKVEKPISYSDYLDAVTSVEVSSV